MTSLKAKVNAYDRPSISRPSSPAKEPVLLRPKAKINTSAAFGTRRPTSSLNSPSLNSPRSAVSTSNRAPSPFKLPPPRAPSPYKLSPPRPPSPSKTVPRAPSPFKHSQRFENQSLPASSSVKSRLHAHPKSTISPRSNPPSPDKRRRPSLTILHHSKSVTTLAPRTAPPSPLVPTKSPLDEVLGPSSLRNSQTISRVTSKVTKMANVNSQSSEPLSVPGRATFTRPRVPSVSNQSTLAASSTPSAILPSKLSNMTKHKRGISQTKTEPVYQTFQLDDDQTIHRNAYISTANNSKRRISSARVDPSLIPLPPISPPTSNVSFSSRSSRSSVSHDTNFSGRSEKSPVPAFGSPNGFDTDDGSQAEDYEKSRETSPTLADEAHSSDRRMKAEAKSVRKIADLEITNRSLMVINATLEAAKHRQAKEIRDLRRKLRESRLILPPQTYREVKSSDDSPDYDDDLDDDDDDEDADVADFADDKDEGFKRVQTILDALLDQGRRALTVKSDDLQEVDKGTTTKVLHAEELRRSQSQATLDRSDYDPHEFSEADITLPDSDDVSSVEDSADEVEGMISIRITPSLP